VRLANGTRWGHEGCGEDLDGWSRQAFCDAAGSREVTEAKTAAVVHHHGCARERMGRRDEARVLEGYGWSRCETGCISTGESGSLSCDERTLSFRVSVRDRSSEESWGTRNGSPTR
jgi:hypothetical protein